MKQILINLIGNALKFTFEGAITISVQVINLVGNKPELEITVSDTGIGIREEDRDKIF